MKKLFATATILLLVLSGCKTTEGGQEEASKTSEESVKQQSETPEEPSDPFAGCEMTQFTSGWIEASCEDAEFLIQPDRAALATIDQTWTPMSKSLSEEFEADVFGEETELELDGESVAARAFTVARGEGGEELARGIYALWDMGETAKMAAACIQEPAKFDASRCQQGFEFLMNQGIPGSDSVSEAAESGASVVLAGQPIAVGDDCERSAERKVTCESGELTWFQGEADATRKKLDKALADMKDVASASGADVETTERPCTVGDYETTCHAHDISSDAQHAKFHSATISLDGESLAIACWYDATQSMPSACRAIFGDED